MVEWLSYIVAISIGISAVISPIIANIINNHYLIKSKKLDLYESAKRKALSDFIEAATDYQLNAFCHEQEVKFYASLNQLFLYFSNITLADFLEFDIAREKKDYKKATIELSKISQKLSQQIAKK